MVDYICQALKSGLTPQKNLFLKFNLNVKQKLTPNIIKSQMVIDLIVDHPKNKTALYLFLNSETFF